MTVYMRDFPSFRPRQGWLFPIYPATTMSVYLAVSGGGILQSGDCDNAPIAGRIFGWCVVAPLALTAIPVAAAIDTVLLLLDHFRPPVTKSRGRVITASEARTICLRHLSIINLAKYKWADEHNATIGAAADVSEILHYCQNAETVTNCPGGGKIDIGVVDTPPRCSIPGHELP